MAYFYNLLIIISIYLILAQSFNLVFGRGMLLNLSHIAIYACGAYCTALLSTTYEWGVFSCLFFSMLSSGLLALIVAFIALRLNQDYFAIGSLAFSAIILALIVNWRSLTRGVQGIPGISRPLVFGLELSALPDFLLFCLVLTLIVSVFLFYVLRSPFALTLKAQAESAHACQALGRNVVTIRSLSFILASIFAGLAGSMFAYYYNFVDPSSFQLSEMIFVLSIVLLGGPGSYWGVLAATFFLVLLPEPLRFFDFAVSSSALGAMRQLLYASILFIAVYLRRKSLFVTQREV